LETVLLDKAPISGISAMMRDGAVGDAFDGAEGVVEFAPQRVGFDQRGDLLLEGADLAGDHGQKLFERRLHRAVGNQALLIELRGADAGELAQAGDERAQMLLALRGQACRRRVLHLGVPGDYGGVDGVGLLEPAHALGELADRARVEDGDRQALFRELREGLLFVAAGGFHGDEFGLMRMAEGGQGGDAFGVVGERAGGALAADAGLERG
jgi:hypothetical protein